MLDAPVSGGEPKAIDGTRRSSSAGMTRSFDRVARVLGAVGPPEVISVTFGTGNAAELANQVVVALIIAAAAEALVLSQTAGVAPDAVFTTIRGGLAGVTVLDAKAPIMLDQTSPRLPDQPARQGPGQRARHLPQLDASLT